jgi:hypothetical protein
MDDGNDPDDETNGTGLLSMLNKKLYEGNVICYISYKKC